MLSPLIVSFSDLLPLLTRSRCVDEKLARDLVNALIKSKFLTAQTVMGAWDDADAVDELFVFLCRKRFFEAADLLVDTCFEWRNPIRPLVEAVNAVCGFIVFFFWGGGGGGGVLLKKKDLG